MAGYHVHCTPSPSARSALKQMMTRAHLQWDGNSMLKIVGLPFNYIPSSSAAGMVLFPLCRLSTYILTQYLYAIYLSLYIYKKIDGQHIFRYITPKRLEIMYNIVLSNYCFIHLSMYIYICGKSGKCILYV